MYPYFILYCEVCSNPIRSLRPSKCIVCGEYVHSNCSHFSICKNDWNKLTPTTWRKITVIYPFSFITFFSILMCPVLVLLAMNEFIYSLIQIFGFYVVVIIIPAGLLVWMFFCIFWVGPHFQKWIKKVAVQN